MKKVNILYWIFTGVFAAFMLSTSIPNIIMDENSVTFINGLLGFPKYMIPFLGVAKVLGVIGILIPGFPRITEWSYAGLFFDLAGATYAVISVGGFKPDTAFMLVFFAMLALSYIYYHKRLNAKASHNLATA